MLITPITVYHGPTMFRPYAPGEQPLALIDTFCMSDTAGSSFPALLERAWAAFNGHPSSADKEMHDGYYNGQRRSLCVGDVIVIGECAYTCASFGWDLVPLDIDDIKEPGTVHADRGMVLVASSNGWRNP